VRRFTTLFRPRARVSATRPQRVHPRVHELPPIARGSGLAGGRYNGVDNRHQSWHVEPTAMQPFAKAVGADQTLFSTNGSSQRSAGGDRDGTVVVPCSTQRWANDE
jgi:hypothetical protein